MKNRVIRRILRRYAAIAALTLSLVACAKEPMYMEKPTGDIVMTTRASKVEFLVVGTGDIVIDWGDGKKSNLKDAFFDELYKQFVFTHEYSVATPRYIAITGKITRLSCRNNVLTALDVSGSTELTTLECSRNQLTSLDVSKNTALKELLIEHNQLTGLDVSKNTALTHLSCHDNRLTNFILNAANTALGNLNFANNQLTASVLNDLFRELPYITKTEGYEESPEMDFGYIRVLGNPGATVSDLSIAQKKGWRFINR